MNSDWMMFYEDARRIAAKVDGYWKQIHSLRGAAITCRMNDHTTNFDEFCLGLLAQ